MRLHASICSGKRRTIAALGLFLVLCPRPGTVAQSSPAVLVSVEGHPPLTVTLDDLKRLPLHAVETEDVQEQTRYEGALVSDLLKQAGMTFGQTLRGERLQDYLLVEAGDGFRAVYALPELDAQFTDDVTILAYQRAGGPLPERDGALRIVHSGDQRHARWVRGVTALTVVRAK